MKTGWIAGIVTAFCMSMGAGAAQGDSISDVENARAKERAGYRLKGQDREKLDRYGGNDDYGHSGSYRDYGYYDGRYESGVSVYVSPRGYRGYGY